MSRRGFTLVEVVAAVAVVGLAAGLTGLSLHAALARVGPAEAAGALVEYDRTTRLLAQRQRRTVRLELGQHRLTTLDVRGRPLDPPRRDLDLPGGCEIVDVYLPPDVRDVLISPRGRSRSYGLELAGRGTRRWVLVLGLTGESRTFADFDTFTRAWAAAELPRLPRPDTREVPAGASAATF
ncbi:MAG: prepilin-type N-terminal cleavage/methylation domain-containing protein [Phycisphaeraceae bacterium]